MQSYLVVIEKAGENYSAFSPDLSGCITTGKSVDETLVNMREAMELYLEEMDEIPQSKGLEFYLKQGLINEKNISKEYLISNIEVQEPDFV